MTRLDLYGRLSRSGTSRSSEPDGRPTTNPDLHRADLVWDLWNMRALFPQAEKGDLHRILRQREQSLAREREALAGLWAGDQVILSPGRSFFGAHPELHSGITVSLHQGPYQLLAEPWLHAGLDPVLLISAAAEAEFSAATAGMSARLAHKGRLTFLPVGKPGFVKEAVTALRDGRPVLVYLDGTTAKGGWRVPVSWGCAINSPGGRSGSGQGWPGSPAACRRRCIRSA